MLRIFSELQLLSSFSSVIESLAYNLPKYLSRENLAFSGSALDPSLQQVRRVPFHYVYSINDNHTRRAPFELAPDRTRSSVYMPT